MKTHTTVIDLDELFDRSNDSYDPSRYPLNLSDTVALLVEEQRTIDGTRYLPAYQAMPSGLIPILHAAGKISDEEYNQFEKACGVDAPDHKMFTLERVVYGANNYGRDPYLTSLILAGDLGSSNPHAIDSQRNEWHYEFRPGDFSIGKSGRILSDAHSNFYEEELAFRVPIEMVYDAIKGSCLHINKLGLLRSDGSIDIVYMNGRGDYGRLTEMFPEEKEITRRQGVSSKDIDISQIALPQRLQVVQSDYIESARKYSGNFIFQTPHDPRNCHALASMMALQTNHVVWNTAEWDQIDKDPNTHLAYSVWKHMSHLVPRDGFYLGDGRNIFLGRLGEKQGKPHYNDWKREFISLTFDHGMFLTAAHAAGATQIITWKEDSLDSRYDIIFEKGKKFTPDNPGVYISSEKALGKSTYPMDELTEMFAPQGLIPRSNNEN